VTDPIQRIAHLLWQERVKAGGMKRAQDVATNAWKGYVIMVRIRPIQPTGHLQLLAERLFSTPHIPYMPRPPRSDGAELGSLNVTGTTLLSRELPNTFRQ
jgi:hypothetical protein